MSRSFRYRLGESPDIPALLDRELATRVTNAPELPFTGGVIGYLAYECAQLTLPIALSHRSPYPDAYFVRPRSFIVYDHQAETAHLCCLAGNSAEDLLDRLETALGADGLQDTGEGSGASLSADSWRSPGYLERIKRAQGFLHVGESYEVCLTDTYSATAEGRGSSTPNCARAIPLPMPRTSSSMA